MGIIMHPWTQSKDGTFVAELSSLGHYISCPQCQKTLKKEDKSGEDVRDGEVMGIRYNHPCGAKILLIND